jgi:hypothetical protein
MRLIEFGQLPLQHAHLLQCLGILPGRLAPAGQIHRALGLQSLQDAISGRTGQLTGGIPQGGLQMVAGMADGLCDLMPLSLLNPEQAGNTGMFRLACPFLGKIKAQQLGQPFFRFFPATCSVSMYRSQRLVCRKLLISR